MEEILHKAMILTMVVAGVPLLAALLTGLSSGIIQASTQIQEQALSFVPRLLVVSLILFFGSPIVCERMVEFSEEIWESIVEVQG